MDWYYALNREKQGPFDEQTFQSLVEDGTVTQTTLVWNRTMTDWQPYSRLSPEERPVPAAAPSAVTEAMDLAPEQEQDAEAVVVDTQAVPVGDLSDPESAAAVEEGICSQCGRSFSRDDLVSFKDARVCAQCKPVFLQKIREGVSTGTDMAYAGFWIRVGAKIIDSIVIYAVNFAVGMVFGALFMSDINPVAGDPEAFKQIMVPSIIMSLLQWGISIFYGTWFIGRFAATPGKMACGLKVVTAENQKVSYLRAFGRFFAEMISGLILCIGYIMVAFDNEKRGLHDRICSTRVIRK